MEGSSAAITTIRNLDDDVMTRLRVRAVDNGRFLAEEARLILRNAVGRGRLPRTLAVRTSWQHGPGVAPRVSPDANRIPSIEAAALFLPDTNMMPELLRPSPEHRFRDRLATGAHLSTGGRPHPSAARR